MGMYTEFVFRATIKHELPENIESVLDFLFNGGDEEPECLPAHEFFITERWDSIGRCAGGINTEWSLSKYDDGMIFSLSEFKNYHGEIEKFLEWVSPYVLADEGEIVGWKLYEEDCEPSLICMRNGRLQ